MNVRNLVLAVGALVVGMTFTGCSTSSGHIGHFIGTEVQLNQANFDVVGSVTGEASASYFISIGPSRQNIIAQAKQDMIKKARLQGSQALVYVTTDTKYTWFPLWRQQMAYVSAEIVEFK
jgi:hypothetical protein